MTQEELFVELEQAFSADTGIMTIPTRLSDFIDLYAEDDEHWQFVEFFIWVLRNHKDVNRE